MAGKRFLTGFLTVMMAIVCIFTGGSVTVKAADSDYAVDSAEFSAEFTGSGDAVITEKWDVRFISGSFTRFYKDINRPLNQLEYFETPEVISCTINGRDAERSSSLDRIDYHYFFQNTSSSADTIHWFKSSSNETVHYEIKYRIKNAVKLDVNDNAVFCYRFIGDNFSKTVGKTTAVLIMPSADCFRSVTCSSGDCIIAENQVMSDSSNVSGMLKYRLNMDPSAFSDLIRVADVKVPKKKMVPEEIFFVVIFFVLIPLTGLRLIAVAVYRSMYFKIHIKNNKDAFFKDSSDRLESYNIPFMWYLCIPKKRYGRSFLLAFYAEIFDMWKRNRAGITDSGFVFYRNAYDSSDGSLESSMDVEFMELINVFFGEYGGSNIEFLPFNRIQIVLEDNKSFRNFVNAVSGWSESYRNKFKCTKPYQKRGIDAEKLRKIKKELKLWDTYSARAGMTTDAYMCIRVFQRTGNISNYMVLQLLNGFVRTVSTEKEDTDDECYLFCSFFESYAYAASSSDRSGGSGCSSCSSCSSCSGCGGGGAD